jgi:hypothetical protein
MRKSRDHKKWSRSTASILSSRITEIGAVVLALTLVPMLAFTDVELKGTVLKVDKVTNQLFVKTERGEETLLLSTGTKGIGNAKEGAKVIVRFTEKDGQPRVIEIVPQEGGTKENRSTLDR